MPKSDLTPTTDAERKAWGAHLCGSAVGWPAPVTLDGESALRLIADLERLRTLGSELVAVVRTGMPEGVALSALRGMDAFKRFAEELDAKA